MRLAKQLLVGFIFLILIGFSFGAIYKITLDNPNAYDLNDYQVRIDLSSYGVSQYLRVCEDLTCTADLNFCYEQDNGECTTTFSSVIWVKVPHIPVEGSTDIYIFEGETTNYSVNGDKVFDFYDDFDDGVLDPNWNITWSGIGSLSSYYASESNGYLELYAKQTSTEDGFDWYAKITRTNFSVYESSNILIEARAKPYYINTAKFKATVNLADESGNIGGQITFYKEWDDNIYYKGIYVYDGSTWYSLIDYSLSENNVWSVAGLSLLSNKQYGYFQDYGEQLLDGTLNISDPYGTPPYYIQIYFSGGYCPASVCGEDIYPEQYLYIDWVRARKYADQDVSITITNVTFAVVYLSGPQDSNIIKTSKYTIYWKVQADTDTNYITRLYINSNLIYDSGTVSISTGETHPYTYEYTGFTLEGDYNIYVEVYDVPTAITTSDQATVTVDLYDINFIWTNQASCGQDTDGNYYCQSFNWKIVARCGYLDNNTDIKLKIDGNDYNTFTIPCDNTEKTIVGSYANAEGSHTAEASIYRIGEADYVDGNIYSFIIDTTPPDVNIDINIPSDGYYISIPDASAILNINDNLSPTIDCNYTINDSQFSGTFNSGSSTIQNFTPVDGNNIITTDCKDLAGNETTITKSAKLWVKQIKLKDEKTEEDFNLDNHDSVVIRAIIDDYNYLDFDAKANGTTQVYFISQTLPREFRVNVSLASGAYYRSLIPSEAKSTYIFYLIDLTTDTYVLDTFNIVDYSGITSDKVYIRFWNQLKEVHDALPNFEGKYEAYLTLNETYTYEVVKVLDDGTLLTLSTGQFTVSNPQEYTITISQEIIQKYLSIDLNVELIDWNTDTGEYTIHIYGASLPNSYINVICGKDIQQQIHLGTVNEYYLTGTCYKPIYVNILNENGTIIKSFYFALPGSLDLKNVLSLNPILANIIVGLLAIAIAVFGSSAGLGIYGDILCISMLIYLFINATYIGLVGWTYVLIVAGIILIVEIYKMMGSSPEKEL